MIIDGYQSSNFMMFRPPAGGPGAAELHAALLRRGVIIRALRSYGLPGWLRVNAGNLRQVYIPRRATNCRKTARHC